MTTAAQNIPVFLRKSPLHKKHFFEWLKTAITSTACGTSTLKSPLLRAFFTPHVHPRLRKRLARCTLDCGSKTSESLALRGFVGERCPININITPADKIDTAEGVYKTRPFSQYRQLRVIINLCRGGIMYREFIL